MAGVYEKRTGDIFKSELPDHMSGVCYIYSDPVSFLNMLKQIMQRRGITVLRKGYAGAGFLTEVSMIY